MLRLATGRLKSGAVLPVSDDVEPHATAMLVMSAVANAISRCLV